MATIINNPSGTTEDSSAGVVIGLVVALVLIVLFVVFVWPNIGNRSAVPATTDTPAGASTNVNVTLPTSSSAPSTSK